MNFSGTSIAFAPWVPWPVLIGLGSVALVLLLLTAVRGARGVGWRLLAIAALWLTLANPALVNEKREYRKDIGIVVMDDSPSQAIGDRKQMAEAALDKITEEAKQVPDLDLRVVRAGGGAEAAVGDQGTRLFQALERALSDVPRRRFAGAVMITDGEVHDVPADLKTLPAGPIHGLVTGSPGETDRRLVVVRAPGFGFVDKSVTMTIRIEDAETPRGTGVSVSVRRDGGQPSTIRVPANQDFNVDVPITHGGENVLELEVGAGPHELTMINNRAVVAINGIRDRLRVLLISGEPHPGERTWRNLLKADPSVDLVHFTILRPPEKQDGTPINELSLIAFPIRELFQVKLHDFDLIIFDRYRQQNILPRLYIQAIADYVENGGAILEAAGPTDATGLSLYYTPLGTVLPGEPSGKVLEQPFKPALTDIGRRHPVTADLPGAGPQGGNPSWGKWMRQIEITPLRGETLMSGADNEPLLVLDRVGQGRVAQLASDHIWLWSRGYDGGGPQAELLRRLAHWLMKEPDLEEEDLKAVLQGGKIMVTRRSLQAGGAEVTVTDPLDNKRTLQLAETAPGRATGELPVTVPGLYRVEDGKHTALAAIGAINPKEFADVRATESLLQPVTDGSGGGQFWLGQGTPSLRRVGEDRVAHGRDWLGLVAHHDYDVVGIEQVPLLPAAAVLLLGIGGLMLAWRREGK